MFRSVKHGPDTTRWSVFACNCIDKDIVCPLCQHACIIIHRHYQKGLILSCPWMAKVVICWLQLQSRKHKAVVYSMTLELTCNQQSHMYIQRATHGAHAQRGLDYSRTTGYEEAYERYQQLQCYKGMKYNVAILLKRLRSRDMKTSEKSQYA